MSRTEHARKRRRVMRKSVFIDGAGVLHPVVARGGAGAALSGSDLKVLGGRRVIFLREVL